MSDDLTRCSGEIAGGPTRFTTYALGAQLTSFEVAGDEILYASPLAAYQRGSSIRAGIPVCFPWFADGPNRDLDPMHGFVRKAEWELVADEPRADGHEVIWQIGPAQVADQAGRDIWPHDFRATCRQTFTATSATIELTVRNPGAEAVQFEELLHAYLRVDDIAQVSISGLAGATYIDKTRDFTEFTQDGDVTITEFTDRIYDSTANLVLRDGDRRIAVDKENSANTVVWNPFPDRIGEFADLPGDAWKHYVCIEPGNVGGNAVRLGPGTESSFSMTLRVE